MEHIKKYITTGTVKISLNVYIYQMRFHRIFSRQKNTSTLGYTRFQSNDIDLRIIHDFNWSRQLKDRIGLNVFIYQMRFYLFAPKKYADLRMDIHLFKVTILIWA